MRSLRPPYLFSVRLVIALIAGLAVSAVNSQAQTIYVFAQITDQPLGGGVYNYTLTLDNTGTSPVETFWFAWNTYDYDFMTANPTSIVTPSGWSDTVTTYYDYYYGYDYGIEFSTSTTPLAGGASLQFSFDSTMTPMQMAGNNPTFGNPVGTSYASTGPGFSGTEFGPFVAQVVPEPSPLALFAVGTFGLWAFCGRKRRSMAVA